MKKNVKKIKIFAVSAALIIPASLIGFAACDNGESGQGGVSGLIGRFTYNSDREVILTNNPENVGKTDGDTGRPYIYTSDVYPLNTIASEGVVYASSQTLRLKRDYTYEYSYDVLLRKVTQDGNTDLTKLEVVTKGTFTYNQDNLSATFYNVKLSAPTEGEELRYGASIADEGNIFSWRLNSSANYRLDVAASVRDGEEADRYTAGRTVQVEKGEDRVLYDDVFYDDILNDIAPFCSYVTAGSAESGKPSVPDNPEQPEVKEITEARLPAAKNGGVNVSLLTATGAGGFEICFETSDAVGSLTVDGEEVAANKTENGRKVFGYAVDYRDFGKTLNVKAGADSFDFCAADYVNGFIKTDPNQTLEQKSLTAFCVSVLNMAKVSGAEISLTGEQKNLLYDGKNENRYHSDFTARDNMTVSGSGSADFFWGEIPAIDTENGVALIYNFAVTEGAYLRLSAKFTVGGISYTVPVDEVKTESGKTYYTAKTESISPLDFDKSVKLEVFDGSNKISGEAAYSVTRGAAKADLSDDGQIAALSEAIYSLGKSATWYANRNGVTYSYLPPVDGNGRYELTIGEYSYGDSRMTVEKRDYGNHFGTSVYVNETLTSDTNKETLGDGFTAIKADGWFYVTLGGATVDGIRPSANAPESVMIIVNGVSQTTNVLKCAFGDGTVDASVKSFSDLIITGKKGAVLDIYGSIYAQNSLRIENVTVNVYGAADKTAVSCGSLDIGKGAELNIKNNSSAVSAASGVVCKGGVSVSGALRSEGYANGVYLDGETAKGITVSDGGLYIVAKDYGITGNAPAVANKQLIFDGGESYIRANSGIRYCDLTVGEGSATIIADGGYTVEGDGTALRTTSGSVEKGSLNLINNFYNEWWDVNYTVKVGNMLLNGGKVYIFGMCKNGVVHTVKGSLIEVKNCDLTIENGQSLKTSYGRGINAENGDERIEVTNSAKVIFRNCDAAVSCWSKSGGESFAVLNNEGLIILDTYKVGLAAWELGSWEIKLAVTGNGLVRTANYLG